MRCRACNKNLSDREASTKWNNWREISNPEERYIELCGPCLADSGITGTQNPNASEEEYEDFREENGEDNEDES